MQQGSKGSANRNPVKHTVWRGVLKWTELPKAPNASQIIKRSVACQVANPDLKADTWPKEVTLQLKCKCFFVKVFGPHLKNSRHVLFHPQPCEDLEYFTEVMKFGLVGYVHFFTRAPAPCEIKVLIFFYSREKQAISGLMLNNTAAAAVVDSLRSGQKFPGPIIGLGWKPGNSGTSQSGVEVGAMSAQQPGSVGSVSGGVPQSGQQNSPEGTASNQSSPVQLSGMQKPGNSGTSQSGVGVGAMSAQQPGSVGSVSGRVPQSGQQNSSQSTQQDNVVISRTNTIAMEDGQIKQNIVTSSAPQMQQQVGQPGGAGTASNQSSPVQLSGMQISLEQRLKELENTINMKDVAMQKVNNDLVKANENILRLQTEAHSNIAMLKLRTVIVMRQESLLDKKQKELNVLQTQIEVQAEQIQKLECNEKQLSNALAEANKKLEEKTKVLRNIENVIMCHNRQLKETQRPPQHLTNGRLMRDPGTSTGASTLPTGIQVPRNLGTSQSGVGVGAVSVQQPGSIGSVLGGVPHSGQQTSSQSTQQGNIKISQTNTIAMEGGQIKQNIVTSSASQMQQKLVSHGQSGGGGTASNQSSPVQLSGMQKPGNSGTSQSGVGVGAMSAQQPGSVGSVSGRVPQSGQQNSSQSTQQDNVVISRTNTIAMEDGQIKQNIVTSSAPQMQQQVGQPGGAGTASNQSSPVQLSGMQDNRTGGSFTKKRGIETVEGSSNIEQTRKRPRLPTNDASPEEGRAFMQEMKAIFNDAVSKAELGTRVKKPAEQDQFHLENLTVDSSSRQEYSPVDVSSATQCFAKTESKLNFILDELKDINIHIKDENISKAIELIPALSEKFHDLKVSLQYKYFNMIRDTISAAADQMNIITTLIMECLNKIKNTPLSEYEQFSDLVVYSKYFRKTQEAVHNIAKNLNTS